MHKEILNATWRTKWSSRWQSSWQCWLECPTVTSDPPPSVIAENSHWHDFPAILTRCFTKAELSPSYLPDMATGPALSELKNPDCGQFGHSRLTSKKENQDCYSTLLPRPRLEFWVVFVCHHQIQPKNSLLGWAFNTYYVNANGHLNAIMQLEEDGWGRTGIPGFCCQSCGTRVADECHGSGYKNRNREPKWFLLLPGEASAYRVPVPLTVLDV